MKNKNLLLIASLGKNLDLSSVSIAGVDMADAFDFCDAFIDSAQWEDGSWLGYDELQIIMEIETIQTLIHEIAGAQVCYEGDDGF